MTEHIARELVEDDDESKRALRRIFPGAQQAVRRLRVSRREALADRGVERLVVLEPTFATGIKPECEHVLGRLPRRRGVFAHAFAGAFKNSAASPRGKISAVRRCRRFHNCPRPQPTAKRAFPPTAASARR